MKVTISSSFHGRELTVNIKNHYKSESFDPVAALDYEIYDRGRDAKYAQRKIREIKAALCGSSDCQCGFNVVEVI